MLILPRLTDDLEIRGEMKRCNSFSPTSHFPHLLLLLVIGPEWVRTIDMRGTQSPGGSPSPRACNTDPIHSIYISSW